MADIRCPNCGKDNPDFLDACQFCQTPLQAESQFQIGDSPTKKNTGELEAILPDWLKDARQQSRESADEDAMEPTITSKLQTDAKPDLLAGLASQSASNDDEIPDWLAGLNPVSGKEASTPPASESISPSDFFAQFEQEESKPAPATTDSAQEEKPAWMGATPSTEQKDELGGWFSQTSEPTKDALPFDLGNSQEEEWKPPEPKESKAPEDLSWLHDLEASSKQTPEPSASQDDMSWMSNLGSQLSDHPSDSQDDLGWLNNLGGISMPASNEPAPAQPASSQDEDLSWLNNLGGVSMPASNEPASTQTSSSQDDDLGWLNNLGGISMPPSNKPAPTQPTSSQNDDLGWLGEFGSATAATFDEPASTKPASSQDTPDWLKDFGGTPTPATETPASIEPASLQDTPDWLKDFGGVPTPATEETTPAQPVSSQEDADWLKNLGGTLAEEPTATQPESPQNDADWLSSLGGVSAVDESPTAKPFADTGELNWMNSMGQQQQAPTEDASPVSPFMSRGTTGRLDGTIDNTVPDWLKDVTETPSMPPPGAASMDWFKAREEQPPLSAPEPASPQPNSSSSDNLSSVSNQDVDSMFADMPDWISQRPPETSESPSNAGVSSANELAPVELPSWVQAMRPVEAALNDESGTGELANQEAEKEGPLAGFQGLIPSAPIGSSRRPKAFSLKLQATDEQQANAALLEQIIAAEATARPVKSAAVISSQSILRIAVAVLFWLVLGTVIALGSQILPVAAPNNVRGLSDLIATIPDGSPVLVVMDYQPSLVGELEAASGPLLDQMALSRHAQFTFLSTSPNGSALVEHLMHDTKLDRPVPDGPGYQLGTQYFNIGFLPGDSAGVLAFVEDPKTAMPEVNVNSFSEFPAVVLLTDHVESSRVWVEQLEVAKQKDSALADQKLLVVSSAQSGPLLAPYVSSGQVDIMINGLSEAAGYEYVNTTRPGIARSYWDAFGFGLMMAIVLIVIGSLWSLVTGIRARRTEAEQG